MSPVPNRWAILALLYLVRFSTPLHFQSLPPLAAGFMGELGLNFSQFGILIGISSLPGIFLALPGGMLGRRFGDKPMVVCALLLLAGGTVLVALSPDFTVALAGRVLGGVGMALLHVLITKLVTDWFAGRELATAMALVLSSWPLGIGMALGGLGAVGAATSWRTAMLLTAVVPAVAVPAMLFGYRTPPGPTRGHPDAPRSGGHSPRLHNATRRELILSAVAGSVWMVWNVGYISLVSFGPLLLAEQGYPLVWAGVLIAIPSWMSLVAGPLTGYLIDRTGRANLLIGIAIAGSSVLTFLLPFAGMPLLLMIAMGIVRAPAAGGVNALPGTVLHPENRSVGMGLFHTVYYVGMALLPPLAGVLQDTTGTAVAPVLMAATFTALTALPLVGFRLLQRRWAPRPVT